MAECNFHVNDVEKWGCPWGGGRPIEATFSPGHTIHLFRCWTDSCDCFFNVYIPPDDEDKEEVQCDKHPFEGKEKEA